LNAKEFEEMYAHLQFSDFRPGAENLGQNYYLDSITTEYLVEINRSAKKIINDWLLQTERE
ncbi:MAG: hypothetical protein ACTSWW_04805, partial [Promethearchaeota archaeon]